MNMNPVNETNRPSPVGVFRRARLRAGGFAAWSDSGVFAGAKHRPMWRRLSGVALVGALTAALGCHYSTERPFRTDIQTIHVEMFQSKEFRRELEFRLTESIIKRIEMDTPYRIAPRSTADAVLTGEVLRVENRVFGKDFETNLPREIGSTVVVRFQLKDMRTGEILVDRPRFVFQASYIPPVGETFTTGMTRALDGLAEQIVESMETSW
jgi:Lipopolysaccharide-assembly